VASLAAAGQLGIGRGDCRLHGTRLHIRRSIACRLCLRRDSDSG
jgi:hypothetical protein